MIRCAKVKIYSVYTHICTHNPIRAARNWFNLWHYKTERRSYRRIIKQKSTTVIAISITISCSTQQENRKCTVCLLTLKRKKKLHSNFRNLPISCDRMFKNDKCMPWHGLGTHIDSLPPSINFLTHTFIFYCANTFFIIYFIRIKPPEMTKFEWIFD